MNLIDANLVLYAYDASSPRHVEARSWLEAIFSAPDPVRLCWATVVAFLRVATHPRVFEHPLSPEEATESVASWFERPNVGILEPGERHWSILFRLILEAQVRGALVPDAHLAALAIEHGATLCTTDRDFTRFPGLRFVDPLA